MNESLNQKLAHLGSKLDQFEEDVKEQLHQIVGKIDGISQQRLRKPDGVDESNSPRIECAPLRRQSKHSPGHRFAQPQHLSGALRNDGSQQEMPTLLTSVQEECDSCGGGSDSANSASVASVASKIQAREPDTRGSIHSSQPSSRSSRLHSFLESSLAPSLRASCKSSCSRSDGDASIEQSGSGRTLRSAYTSMRQSVMCRDGMPKFKLQESLTTRLWNLLESQDSSSSAKWYRRIMMSIVCASVLTNFLQTVNPADDKPLLGGFRAAVLETSFDTIFFLEILLRFAVCPNRVLFFRNIHNVVDALSVLPLFLRVVVGFELSETDDGSFEWIVLLCFLPIIRLLKTLRYFEQITLLVSAFKIAFEAMPVILFTLMVIVLTFASLLYVSEKRAPSSDIDSLPLAIWCTIVTMTTVGYGDVIPMTFLGRGCVSVLMVMSTVFMAIPIGIVGNAFSAVWEDRDRLLLLQRTRTLLVQGGYTALDIRDLFSFFSNTAGELGLNEFRLMMAALNVGINEERTLALFKSFDDDHSGYISDFEFIRMLYPQSYAAVFERDAQARNQEILENLCQSSSDFEAKDNEERMGSVVRNSCGIEKWKANFRAQICADSDRTERERESHREFVNAILGNTDE